MIGLTVRIAGRELRDGLKGFRIFLACLVLGVGAIAAVGSLGESMLAGLKADGRALLGGDVDLRLLHRPPTPEQEKWLLANAAALSQVVEMKAMAFPAEGGDSRSMVELKAVDGRYPLVRPVTLDPPLSLAEALKEGGAAADAALLNRLGVKVGGTIRVGKAELTVRATVVREPDRVADVFTFGPRLLVSADSLAATGLVLPGSQIRYHQRVLVDKGETPEAWIARLHSALPESEAWQARGPDEAAPGVARFIRRLTLFLGFVGLAILLVGGIGVGNAVSAHLEERTRTIAILKSVGAPARLIFLAYFLQVMAVALLGTFLGVAIGAAAPYLAAGIVGDSLPVAPIATLFWKALGAAALFGLLIAAAFALWPLAKAREVPAAALFRDRIRPARARPRLGVVIGLALAVAALGTLTIATAVHKPFAAWFVVGALATLGALQAGADLLMAAARRIPARRPGWRLALANLHRPGSGTPAVVLSLGVGLAVLVAVAEIEGNLARQIEDRLPEGAPAYFFLDVQDEQVGGFDRLMASLPGTSGFKRVASLRGRIVRIAGEPVEKRAIDQSVAWAVRGDRAVTYAARPPEGAEISVGEWWPADYAGEPLISLDAGVARGFGVGIGDTLTVNVLGRDITGRITSLREIDWRSLRFDFAIIFSPGILEGAPHSHIAAVRADPAVEENVERSVGQAFPNVTVIRVKEALEAASRILEGVATALTGVGGLAILAGTLVLGGAIAATRRRRAYEAVVFKVLGATRRQVLAAYLMEYGLLGLATALAGTAVGTAASWGVVRHLIDMSWSFLPGPALATAGLCLAVALGAGLAGTLRVLGEEAAPHLRNE